MTPREVMREYGLSESECDDLLSDVFPSAGFAVVPVEPLEAEVKTLRGTTWIWAKGMADRIEDLIRVAQEGE